MIEVEHWDQDRTITLAESRSGVRVALHPLQNLIPLEQGPWPTPELLQKFNAAGRFKGRTPQDDDAARSGLGYYCDLQSLHSEDALTWSVCGHLVYAAPKDRHAICAALFRHLGLPLPSDNVVVWLWRRIPHPEKPEASGGPEIDFGIISNNVVVLGEAKWLAPLGSGQGVGGNRDQLDLRAAYLEQLAPRALGSERLRVVLGVSPDGELFCGRAVPNGVETRRMSWDALVDLLPSQLADTLHRHIAWRREHARAGDARQG